MGILSFIPGGLAVKALALFLVAVFLVGFGFRVGYRYESAAYEKFKTEVASAQAAANAAAAAEQAALDASSLKTAQDYGKAQAANAARYATLYEKVKHVKVPTACIPWGLVRVLDAAALGSDTNSLAYPAGVSAGACSPIGWRQLASRIVANYGLARANAGQLNALIGAWKAQDALHNGGKK